MDNNNYFQWFGICTDPTFISEYSDKNKRIHLNQGDLIKISPQTMPSNKELRLIILYNIPVPGDNALRNDKIYLCPESKYAVVEEDVWPYLIVETDSLYRFHVYSKRENILSLKIGEMINIYLNTSPTDEMKVCCSIVYIGEVPEYGKGVNFCLRAMSNFEFIENPQTSFIEKYGKGSRTSLIILTSSAFFEAINFDEVTNRPIVIKQSPIKKKPNSEIQSLEAKLNDLKQRLALGGAHSMDSTTKNNTIANSTLPPKMSIKFNSVSLVCTICRKDCPASSGILLANCGHVFCFDCLTNYINSTTDNIPICPFINKKYKCNAAIEMYEMDSLKSDDTKALIANNRYNRNPSRSPAKRNLWNCSKCTYENSLKLTNCEMCEEPRVQAVELQCMYCFDTCSPANMFTVPECNHSVCKNCLMVYLEYQIKGNVDKAECPIAFCDYALKSRDILEMFLQLDGFLIKNKMNFFDICITCQVAHPNVNCTEFHRSLSIRKDPDSGRLKWKYGQLHAIGDATACPKCQLIIVKQGHEKEYCSTCDRVFKSDYQSKPWQCYVCCNSNIRAASSCGICGKKRKNQAENKKPTASCMFCTLEIKFNDGVALNCSHFFCKPCLETLVQTNETVLKCPYEQHNNKCSKPIEEYELLQIMGIETYKRYKIRLMRDFAKETENSVLCLDENCTGWSLKEDLIDSNLFICSVCRKPSCLACKAVHAGMTCALYNNPVEREQFLQPQPQQYNVLVKMDDDQMIKNIEPFECPICYLDVGVGEGITLRECLHVFCKDCITNHVKHTDGVEAKCPFVDNNYKCESIILEREIKAIADDKTYNKYIDKWYTIGKNNIEHGVQCNTVNCNGFWENDENINEQECPLCKAINCLNCQAIHPDMKCDEFQTSIDTKKKLEDEIAKGIGMRCPKCKIIIMRVSGCDWLQCTMCRTEICWVTKGARWGPNGTGDTSGGCRCKVNGRKCHPNCGNCH